MCDIFSHDLQGTNTVTVQTKILRAGIGNDNLRHGLGQIAQALGILIQSTAQTLIGRIDKRGKTVLLRQTGDLLPVIHVQIRPGRVMTA
jgi:hypothetical protein